MNINGVDPGVVKELVNQRGERKPQPLVNVDFRPEDAVISPPDHTRADCELGAQRRKGNANLRRKGVLPPKFICAKLSDGLEPGNDSVGIRARENFPGRGRRRVWFFTRATVGEEFSMGHPVSSSMSLSRQGLEDMKGNK